MARVMTMEEQGVAMMDENALNIQNRSLVNNSQ